MKFVSWLGSSPLVGAIFAVNLLVSFHYFFVIYINSSYITGFVDEGMIGYLYVVGSVFSTVIFISFIALLRRIGNVRLITLFVLLEALSLVGLMLARDTYTILAAFLLHLAAAPVIYLSLDIFLEKSIRSEQITGSARGLFLTMLNIAQVSSPILVGLLLVREEYWKVYGVSIVFLLLALIVIVVHLRRFQDPVYTHPSIQEMVERLLGNRVFRNVFAAQFLLRFFYAWMVIYTPLYLFRHVGLEWSEIGVIFTIMLVPFLLLEFPLGRAVDLLFGERELMTGGFVILGVTVACIPFVTHPQWLWWAALLFATRVGASFVEVASESYFFKHVDGRHASTISLFRIARPATYVLAATVASLALLVVPIQWTFLVLAVVMCSGIYFARTLRETK